ncbi:voltage-dependent T-type calcium channel subunit alpha-1H-like [Pyrgilauda ruficollis]|uniref:voltage-dependent T-type calcium channel subunit alpha-1H-like n=1 Tax=Pyrgilauda ruficollis TaxID=221976 RepID=UPI001B881C14|nr:voltage-dependent T-type calcium channel subunit alpha-1H-like [Pyrgilauda ruficollis]
MSAGESREPPRPAEVRVPITALPAPRRPAEQPPEDAGSGSGSGSGSSSGSPGREPPAELGSEEEEQVPYPALAPTAFFCLKQTTRPRSWCLRLVCNPYPFPRDTPGTPRHPRDPPRGRSIPAELRVPAAGSAPGMPRSHRRVLGKEGNSESLKSPRFPVSFPGFRNVK